AGLGAVLELLYGLRSPLAGSVRLDGQDLREIKLNELRRSVALVRDTEIVHGTVLDNLRLGRDIPLPELYTALRTVGLLEELLALPDGLNTLLFHHAGPLTQEQGLRLTLARAIAGRPRLLLLHRVLDRMDNRVAQTVIPELLRPDAPWTLVTATNSPAVLAHCGRVGRLDGGRLTVTEAGHG
ncbi:ATP-binding cassette domain-containing protein, partial [Methylogaea oryzae]